MKSLPSAPSSPLGPSGPSLSSIAATASLTNVSVAKPTNSDLSAFAFNSSLVANPSKLTSPSPLSCASAILFCTYTSVANPSIEGIFKAAICASTYSTLAYSDKSMSTSGLFSITSNIDTSPSTTTQSIIWPFISPLNSMLLLLPLANLPISPLFNSNTTWLTIPVTVSSSASPAK